MDDVFEALSLSLIAKKRFVISSDNSSTAIEKFAGHLESLSIFKTTSTKPNDTNIEKSHDLDDKTDIIKGSINVQPSCSYTVIDLLTIDSTINLINQMIYSENGQYHLTNIIIWQNLQKLSENQFKLLYKLILQLDQFEMIENLNNNNIKIDIGELDTLNEEGQENSHIEITKPEIFSIIPFMEFDLNSIKIYTFLKERFWFSVVSTDISKIKSGDQVFENIDYNWQIGKQNQNSGSSYLQRILILRKIMNKVFVSPDIKRYIYSLAVFTRCHRIASISPKSVRASTQIMDYVIELCKAIIVWKHKDNLLSEEYVQGRQGGSFKPENQIYEQELYITPNVVKIAFKKVGYWLVDWEYNKKFAQRGPVGSRNTQEIETTNQFSNLSHEDKSLEYQKQLQISFLTGDWFGCEYKIVKQLLRTFESEKDSQSPTGFTNKIIEDALESVRPPL